MSTRQKEKVFGNLIKISFLVVICQCFYLQIIRFPFYSRLSRKNCIRTIEIGTPRGKIYDRNGRVMAQDAPCFNLVFIPYDIKNRVKEAEILSGLISVNKERLVGILSRSYTNPFDRIIIKKRIGKEEVALIEENMLNLPGIFIQPGVDREYLLKEDICHVLGYTGEISRSQLKKYKEKGLKSGDIIGQYGIEKHYDDYLRGIPGGIQVEVDAIGHQGRVLGKKEMKPGNNLILTIDQTIQEIASEALGEKQGCVIAMDPRNGQILALVSNPFFDPNRVALSLNEPDHPFFNRAIHGQYPPGSIFKIITEIAALETGMVEEYDRIECTGEIEVRERLFHCWEEEGHGWIDINLALPFSCNIFFGTIGIQMGTSKMLEYAKILELGKPTGINLPGEKSGFIPSPYEIGPVNLSIGQGNLLTTPIQLLSLISTVANGGNIWQPYVVKKIVSPDGKPVKEFFPVLKKTVYISPETMDVLKRGLKNVMLFGTGVSARVEDLDIAGKTGTSQRGHIELELPTQGSFACYAPADKPTIVLFVFIDYGHSWQAARIAGKILKRVFFPVYEETSGETELDISNEENKIF